MRRGLTRFAEETRADEIMVASAIYDHQARLRSYELLAEIGIAPQAQAASLEACPS